MCITGPRAAGGLATVHAPCQTLRSAFSSSTTRPSRGVTDARPQRLSSKGIAPGDVVEVDKKGRRFHAIVVALQQRDSGRFELELRPLDNRISYRVASVREVVGLWRKAALPQRD